VQLAGGVHLALLELLQPEQQGSRGDHGHLGVQVQAGMHFGLLVHIEIGLEVEKLTAAYEIPIEGIQPIAQRSDALQPNGFRGQGGGQRDGIVGIALAALPLPAVDADHLEV